MDAGLLPRGGVDPDTLSFFGGDLAIGSGRSPIGLGDVMGTSRVRDLCAPSTGIEVASRVGDLPAACWARRLSRASSGDNPGGSVRSSADDVMEYSIKLARLCDVLPSDAIVEFCEQYG